MASQLFTNNAKGRLQGSITNVATSLTLQAGEGGLFPAPSAGDWFLITLYTYDETGETSHEICKCTTRVGDVFTIVRGQEGTTALAWGSTTPVELRVTKETLERFFTDSIYTTVGLLKRSAADTYTTITDNSANWNLAFTHKSSTGADHTYINQDVTTTGNPTFNTLATTGAVTEAGTALASKYQAIGTYNTIIGIDTDLDTTGAQVIDTITLTDGVIQGMTTRNLTPADIGAAANISDLTDVTITTIAAGELLKWSGTGWVNNTLAEAGIQAAGTYNTIIGIDTDYTLTGANVFSGLTLTDGVIQAVATRALTAGDIGAATAAHQHTAYDRASSVLSGANVFSNLVITDGIVTSTATRALTAGDIGAATTAHQHTTYDRVSSVLSGANVFSDIVITDGIVTSTATRALTAANVSALSTGTNAAGTFTQLTLDDKLTSLGDTDTYFQFHGANLARMVVANAEVMEWGADYCLMSDNDQLRLGSSSDFRMYFNGTDTYLRNYANAGGDIIIYGNDSGGVAETCARFDFSGTASYCQFYYGNLEKIRTTSAGATVYGQLYHNTNAANFDAFASGTQMLFRQTAVPTGWTVVATYDNMALRLRSTNTVSQYTTGVTFTTALNASHTSGGTAISLAQTSNHRHSISMNSNNFGGQSSQVPSSVDQGSTNNTQYTNYSGSGNTHTHSVPNFNIDYVDVWIGNKT